MTVQKLERPERAADARAGSSPADMLTDLLERALGAVAEPAPALSGAGRWWVTGARGGIEVHAALGGHVPAVAQRLTRLAAGPALLAVRLTVAVTGRRPFTTLFPDPRHPGVVATVRHGTAAPPTQAERTLFATLVMPGARPSGASEASEVRSVLPLLWQAAEAEGAWTRGVTGPDERARLEEALPVVGEAPPQAHLFVLGSHHVRAAGDVQAGQAVQRVLLTARALGLEATVLAGPPELATVRRTEIPGAGPGLLPQVVLCVARPAPE